MQHGTFPIRALVLASLLVSVSSCGDKPRVLITPPANLLQRADEPPMTPEALTSEEVYEQQRDAKIEWGRSNAAIIDRACWWMQDAGVKLDCRTRPE